MRESASERPPSLSGFVWRALASTAPFTRTILCTLIYPVTTDYNTTYNTTTHFRTFSRGKTMPIAYYKGNTALRHNSAPVAALPARTE